MPALRLLAVAFWYCVALHRPEDSKPRCLRKSNNLVRAFDGEIGVFALDLGSRAEVALNADIRFPTASTIKTAVMVEAYHQAAEGAVARRDTHCRRYRQVGGSGVLNGMSSGTRPRCATSCT